MSPVTLLVQCQFMHRLSQSVVDEVMKSDLALKSSFLGLIIGRSDFPECWDGWRREGSSSRDL